MAVSNHSNEGIKPTAQPRRHRRKRIVLCASILALILIALALGLGLGLGLRGHGSGGSTPTSSPTSTATPAPTPTAIYQPAANSTWQIILKSTLELNDSSSSVTPDVDVYDIDMFLHQNNTVISNMHRLNKKVICYFSAGSFEPYTPDASQFQASDKGKELDGWPGEYWLDLNSANVRSIMSRRIQIALDMGCDAIDPDNVDGYQNDNGLGLASNDSTDFMQFLAQEASSRKLGIGLKNAGDIISDVLSLVQFSVNEQCAQYKECATFAPFIAAGKPVFHIEYPDSAGSSSGATSTIISTDCSAADATDFSTVLKQMALGPWVQYCNGQIAETVVLS